MLFLWGPPSGPKLERAADARSAIVCAVLFWVNGDDLLPYSNAATPSLLPFFHHLIQLSAILQG